MSEEGRTVPVIMACVSMVLSFVWMPFYPLWSLVIIALDLFVILRLHLAEAAREDEQVAG